MSLSRHVWHYYPSERKEVVLKVCENVEVEFLRTAISAYQDPAKQEIGRKVIMDKKSIAQRAQIFAQSAF